MTYFNLGEFTEGGAYAEKALTLYDPAHRATYAELLSHDALVMLQLHSSFLLGCLGHLDHALLLRDVALDEARRLSHLPTLAAALGSLAWVIGSFARLEPGLLLQYADEALALTAEHGLVFYQAVALMERGWYLTALGRAEGTQLVTAGMADWQELGFILNRPWALTLLGDACRMADQWQTALKHLAEARHLADETGERWFQSETVRLTGDVLAAMGDRTEAEASYHEAMRLRNSRAPSSGNCVPRPAWRGSGRPRQARGSPQSALTGPRLVY